MYRFVPQKETAARIASDGCKSYTHICLKRYRGSKIIILLCPYSVNIYAPALGFYSEDSQQQRKGLQRPSSGPWDLVVLLPTPRTSNPKSRQEAPGGFLRELVSPSIYLYYTRLSMPNIIILNRKKPVNYLAAANRVFAELFSKVYSMILMV